ncbi:hypothetical protein L873DRAFT_1908582 [Choiromyces venosus 120613-1]|uniref:DDE Tnp4 domain-containing protein n=1 Tax=Choiromyces venosus 120613-1 TaxID=1336337 RepID=A0A3N4KGY5_9PEZI|nr:hypothetical protein L873DRAFT_1908582 [Choiromyces venosus 120613-1]
MGLCILDICLTAAIYTNNQMKESSIPTIWGFVDSTIHGIARPTRWQHIYYNSWKRKHCLKYHAIVMLDGLISHLFGSVNRCRNDDFLWRESNLPRILQQHAHAPDGTPLQVYGDPAYSISNVLLSLYQGMQVTLDQKL